MIAVLLAMSFLADGPAIPAEDSTLGFAHSLFEEGDYYRAIGEAKRYLYEHPKDARAPEARLLVGQCYLAGSQWNAAAAALEPLAAEVSTGRVGADAAFALADARVGAGDYDLAALEYHRFGDDFPEDPRAALSSLRTAWARMFAADVIATLNPGRGRTAFLAAALELDALPASHVEKVRATRLAAGAHRLAALPTRSPALAGVFSAIVPGAGQFYCGRWKDGVIALFVNGIFIGGAVESAIKGNDLASAILVLFEMGWYTGNIYSAVNSAHRSNDDRRADLLRDLKKDLYLQAAPLTSRQGLPDGATALLGGRF